MEVQQPRLPSSVMSKKGAKAPVVLPDLTTTKEVITGLKSLYAERMRPIEVAYNFAEVRKAWLTAMRGRWLA